MTQRSLWFYVRGRTVRGRMMISRRQFLKRAGYIGAVATYPCMVEHYLVQINFYRIPISNLPHSFSGFKIVQLTDLHFGALFQTQWLYYITEITNNIKGDIIVCTGDYVQGTSGTREIDIVWDLLSTLNAKSNLELNRYLYPTSPARIGNGVVNHSLSKFQDSVRGPVLSLPRSLPQRS